MYSCGVLPVSFLSKSPKYSFSRYSKRDRTSLLLLLRVINCRLSRCKDDNGSFIVIVFLTAVASLFHFQDHGGVMLGDGCLVGHNVVFATLNHGMAPEDRGAMYPAPIRLGKNVWVWSHSTILRGVTVGDNVIIAAGSVVTKDVAANTVVGGVPAKYIRNIGKSREQ